MFLRNRSSQPDRATQYYRNTGTVNSPGRRRGYPQPFRSNRPLGFNIMAILIPTLMVLGAAGGIGWAAAWTNTTNVVTCTVNDKDRTTDTDGNSNARIYTDDCGVFQVADDLSHANFTSADTYSQIKPGGTYKFTTLGWRLPIASIFPNIIKVSVVD